MNSDVAVVREPIPAKRQLTNRRVLLWIAALLPFLAVALWRLGDGPGIDADDYGQYLMHARALVEGRPYSDIGYIYSRFRYGLGPAAAPPGLPVTLAAIYKVFGPDMLAMRLEMLCFATAFVLLAGLYFSKHQGFRIGVGVALLCGLSPAVAHAATQLLTDLPFAALFWAIIYIMDLPGRLNVQRLLAVTFLGAYAMSFRVPGAALFPALILFTALRLREQGLRPLVPALLWVLGLLAVMIVMPIQNFAVIRFGKILDLDSAQIIANARTYLSAIFESHLHPFPTPLLNDLFHVATAALMLIGLVAWLRTSYNKFSTVFAFTYGALLLLVPFSQDRYLWPLFPLFVFGLLNGVRVIAVRLAPALRQRADVAALSFAVVLVPFGIVATIREPRRVDLLDLPEMQQVIRVLRADSDGRPLRVVFYKPRSFAWRTGIPAMGAIGGPPACLISELTRGQITHVIGGQGLSTIPPELSDIRQFAPTRPDLFSERFRTRDFVVYRFNARQEEADAAVDVCKQLRRNRSGR